MLIGLPREIKNHEYRAGLTPASVRKPTSRGHAVLVQTGTGAAIGLSDERYTVGPAKFTRKATQHVARPRSVCRRRLFCRANDWP